MQTAGGRRLERWAPTLSRMAAGLGVAAFAAWEGMQGRYSVASHVSILVVIAVVLVTTLVAGRARHRKRSRTWARDVARLAYPTRRSGDTASAMATGSLVWTLLIAVTVAWDAVSFAVQRHWLPTLSRVFGAVTDHQAGRALFFAAWLALGLYLALGRRTPHSEHEEPDPHEERRP